MLALRRECEHRNQFILTTSLGSPFLSGILLVPMRANGCRHFYEPTPILGMFKNIGSRKELNAVGSRVTERLEKP